MQTSNIIEKLSYEEIFSRMKEELVCRDETFSALVESDPAMKVLEVAAWRELLLRQRINESAPEQTKSVKPERNVLMHIAVIFGYNFMKKCFCSYNRVRNGAINARGSV